MYRVKQVQMFRGAMFQRVTPALLFLGPVQVQAKNKLSDGPSVTGKPRDYQYLERSKIPTMKFQKSLLRLPIPSLDNTTNRYLTALEPFTPAPELNKTHEIVKRSEDSLKSLHAEVVALDHKNKHTSYISAEWFSMYLSNRDPLVLNNNPFMSWKKDPNPEFMHPAIRTTNMIISALRFRRSLLEEKLAPEVFHMNPKKTDTDWYRNIIKLTPDFIASYVSMALKVFPLDMSQFNSLFNTTRIPRKGKDELVSFPGSKHVVFIRKGQFFVVDVLDQMGEILEPNVILSSVQAILDMNIDHKADCITSFSAQNRDYWANIRQLLITSNETNMKNLSTIDSALFTIALDDLSFNEETERLPAAHNYLHGNSIKQGDLPLNRWFDKSFGFILDQKGNAAITFEHSWGDGVAVLRVFNDIFIDSIKHHFVSPETEKVPLKQGVKHLKFTFDDELKKAVKESVSNWKSHTATLDMNYVLYDKMNRDYFKKMKLSPDSMFQLAFQMAYYQVHDSFAPTYESCSTSAFKHGRTEVVRAATKETKLACEAFFSKDKKGPQELRKLLDACSKKHFTLTKEAAMGQGFDRHLFAMRVLAERKGYSIPELYLDPVYTRANHFVLSTSSLYGEFFTGGGFAPVVKDGFGLGYGYVDDQLGMLCTSYKGQRDGAKMAKAFTESLDRIKEVLEHPDSKV